MRAWSAQRKWKSFTCPFCAKKNTAGVFTHEGIDLFKCQSTSCQTGAKAMDAIGYIAFIHGRSRQDTFLDYLKMAGVWKKRARLANAPSPATQPGQQATESPRVSSAEHPVEVNPSSEQSVPAAPQTSEAPVIATASPVSGPAPTAAGSRPATASSPFADGATPEAIPSPPVAEFGDTDDITEEHCRQAMCEFYASSH